MGRPLFPGMDSTDQLYLMFKARGTPSFDDFTQLNPALETPVIEQLLQTPRSARSWSYLLQTDRLSRSCHSTRLPRDHRRSTCSGCVLRQDPRVDRDAAGADRAGAL